MNKIFSIAMLSILLAACNKEKCEVPSFTVNQQQLQTDIDLIDQYLTDNGLTAEIHNTGIRYEVVSRGTGSSIDNCSKIYVNYKGMLLDGTVFDETAPNSWATFNLSQLISGWQVILPLILEKGEVNIYLPSGYGYGEAGSGSTIPPNSPLIFNIKVLGVINQIK